MIISSLTVPVSIFKCPGDGKMNQHSVYKDCAESLLKHIIKGELKKLAKSYAQYMKSLFLKSPSTNKRTLPIVKGIEVNGKYATLKINTASINQFVKQVIIDNNSSNGNIRVLTLTTNIRNVAKRYNHNGVVKAYVQDYVNRLIFS